MKSIIWIVLTVLSIVNWDSLNGFWQVIAGLNLISTAFFAFSVVWGFIKEHS